MNIIDEPQQMSMALRYIEALQNSIHQDNIKWWLDKEGNPRKRNKGELLFLIHSEISECMEGEREDLMDTHLPNRKMAEVALADALIRILDYAAGFNYNVAGAVFQKLLFNRKRADHSYEARERADGKEW